MNSTIVKDVELKIGQQFSLLYLFEVAGDNINVVVSPPLPAGVNLISESGAIYGTPEEYVEATVYSFIVTNVESSLFVTVDITLSFIKSVCEASDGFPETIATVGGTVVTIKCGSGKEGYKSRKCRLTDSGEGKWDIIDDSLCKMSDGVLGGIVIGSIAVVFVIVIAVLFFIFRCGVLKKRVKNSKSRDEKQLDNGIRM